MSSNPTFPKGRADAWDPITYRAPWDKDSRQNGFRHVRRCRATPVELADATSTGEVGTLWTLEKQGGHRWLETGGGQGLCWGRDRVASDPQELDLGQGRWRGQQSADRLQSSTHHGRPSKDLVGVRERDANSLFQGGVIPTKSSSVPRTREEEDDEVRGAHRPSAGSASPARAACSLLAPGTIDLGPPRS